MSITEKMYTTVFTIGMQGGRSVKIWIGGKVVLKMGEVVWITYQQENIWLGRKIKDGERYTRRSGLLQIFSVSNTKAWQFGMQNN